MAVRAVFEACAVALLSAKAAFGHSWPENPLPRGYRKFKEGACLKDETGQDSWHGVGICGKDALGLDIRNLRPSSYLQKPCTVSRDEAGYDEEYQLTRVEHGGKMCVSWAANAHNNDRTRDMGGGVRIAISDKAEPTEADFDSGVMSYIPYDRFEGALIQMPEELKPGQYTMQFAWDWPTGKGQKFLNDDALAHLYANCMDVVVTEKGDSTAWHLGTKLKGKWLPAQCNAEGKVYDVKEKPDSPDPEPAGAGDQITPFVPGVDPVELSTSGLVNPDFVSAMMGWNIDLGNAEVVAPSTKNSGLPRPTLRLEPAEFGSKVSQAFEFQANIEYVLLARVSLRGGITLKLDIQNQKCGNDLGVPERTCAEAGLLVPGGKNPTWPYAMDDEGWHKVTYTFKPKENVRAPVIIQVDKYQTSGEAFVDSLNILASKTKTTEPTPDPCDKKMYAVRNAVRQEMRLEMMSQMEATNEGTGQGATRAIVGLLVAGPAVAFLTYHYKQRSHAAQAAMRTVEMS